MTSTSTLTEGGACSYSLTATTDNVAYSGSSDTVGVTASPVCSWNATTNVNWIVITGGTTGTGSGSVGYTVAANTTGSTRTGSITVAGQVLTITQRKAPASKRGG